MGGLSGADAWGLLLLDSRDRICCGLFLSMHMHAHACSRTLLTYPPWQPGLETSLLSSEFTLKGDQQLVSVCICIPRGTWEDRDVAVQLWLV